MFVGCATKVLEVTSARPSMPVCSKLTVIMSAAAVERLSALVSAHRSKWGQLSGAASGKGGKLPLWVDVQKLCVCFHRHGTSSYHTTNTLQGRRAKSHVDTQTIQPGLGNFVAYSRPHIDQYLTFPSVTKSWWRHWVS